MNTPCHATQITPLMASVMGKQPQSLEVLLRCGAAVDAVDKHGYTVYHHAVIFCAVVITVSMILYF